MRNLAEHIQDEFAREQIKSVNKNEGGVCLKNFRQGRITRTCVVLKEGNALGRPSGNYFTFEVDNLSEDVEDELVKVLKKSIQKLLPKVYNSILILGMGNSEIISDALGTKTIEKIDIIKLNKNKKAYKFCPGVISVSGMESFSAVIAIVQELLPDVVIVVDSLCTRDISRLGKNFQITDAGIVPGSAVGNQVCNLSRETLGGAVVLSIGVPVVVYLHSVLQEFLDKFNPPNNLSLEGVRQYLEGVDGIFSPKDIDWIINFSSQIVSRAIMEAIG